MLKPAVCLTPIPRRPCRLFADFKKSLDTHTATIDWGDGTDVGSLLVTEIGGSGTLSGEHMYENSGVYELTITLIDDDGGVTVKKGQVLVYQLLYLPLVIKG
jgi:hypothetical protein